MPINQIIILILIWVGLNINQDIIEICDNAFDDDLDGLIDLNDPDCICQQTLPSSLIPNPSFEDTICCPTAPAQLNCARSWIQASEATTDLFHLCGLLDRDTIPIPFPFPDGSAMVGFRNGSTQPRNPNFKEYTGACLSKPLRKGVAYRLQFHLGFSSQNHSPPLNVSLFGATDCRFLPFGKFDEFFGCPTNGPGWQLLDSSTISGNYNWVQNSFDFTPTEDIYAVAIGPDCNDKQLLFDGPYYFLDNLILAEISEFEDNIVAEDNPCQEDFSLSVPDIDSLEYQWYRDGVALPGENNHMITGFLETGRYQIRTKSGATCKISNGYWVDRSETKNSITETICDQDFYSYHGHNYPVPGHYYDTLKTQEGCDSIIELLLLTANQEPTFINAKIFPGEQINISNNHFSHATYDTVHLQSRNGCDSLVILSLSFYDIFIPNAFSPNQDGINDQFIIFGNEDLLMVKSLQIFDRWGNLQNRQENIYPSDSSNGWNGKNTKGEELNPGVYIYILEILTSDLKTHTLTGDILLIR